jgi:glc operon protein GlcG
MCWPREPARSWAARSRAALAVGPARIPGVYENKVLGLDDARRAIDAVLAVASTEPDRPIVVTVVDPEGEAIAFARMDRAGHLPRGMAAKKAYTSARMGADSGAYGERMRKAGIALADLDPKFVGFAGAVCLRSGDVVVGAVGVSGRSADEDEQLARVGAAAIGL